MRLSVALLLTMLLTITHSCIRTLPCDRNTGSTPSPTTSGPPSRCDLDPAKSQIEVYDYGSHVEIKNREILQFCSCAGGNKLSVEDQLNDSWLETALQNSLVLNCRPLGANVEQGCLCTSDDCYEFHTDGATGDQFALTNFCTSPGKCEIKAFLGNPENRDFASTTRIVSTKTPLKRFTLSAQWMDGTTKPMSDRAFLGGIKAAWCGRCTDRANPPGGLERCSPEAVPPIPTPTTDRTTTAIGETSTVPSLDNCPVNSPTKPSLFVQEGTVGNPQWIDHEVCTCSGGQRIIFGLPHHQDWLFTRGNSHTVRIECASGQICICKETECFQGTDEQIYHLASICNDNVDKCRISVLIGEGHDIGQEDSTVTLQSTSGGKTFFKKDQWIWDDIPAVFKSMDDSKHFLLEPTWAACGVCPTTVPAKPKSCSLQI